VGTEPGRIDYRTELDTFVKLIGHDPAGEGTPRSSEVFTPNGLVIEYGTSDGTRPLYRGAASSLAVPLEGAPRLLRKRGVEVFRDRKLSP